MLSAIDGAWQAVKHMPPQQVSGRQLRMVEVVGGIMSHAELFHHPAGAQIAGDGEGHDFFKPKNLKSIIHHCTRAFSRQTLSPQLRCDSPSRFHTRRESRFERRHAQADEAGERPVASKLGRVRSESMLAK